MWWCWRSMILTAEGGVPGGLGLQLAKRIKLLAAPNCRALHIETDLSAELLSSPGEDEKDPFNREFLQNRIEMNCLQKALLATGSSLAALYDPRRHDMIACLGEITGLETLQYILYNMHQSDEGQRILEQKPRINSSTIDLDMLRQLPSNTFGHVYVKFLDDNNVTPDSRMPVQFLEDTELAYVMTRYRECHDLVHAILDMPTNMLGEVAVKWVEALNNGLPMCYGGAVFGALRLKAKQRQLYMSKYLPWAINNGRNAKPLMNVYWEEHWLADVDELRQKLNITTLQL